MTRTILITGSTKGIGLELARKFYQSNWNVLITSRSNVDLENLGFIKNDKTNIQHFKVDFTKLKDVIWLKNNLALNNIGLDCLIANVGHSSGAKGLISDFQENLDLINTNLITAIRALSLVDELVSKCENSRIILIGSAAAKARVGAPINYSASKSALVTLLRYFAQKFAKYKIPINLINPGHIHTDEGVWAQKIKENSVLVSEIVRRNIPMDRLSHGEELAEFIFRIVNSESNYLTGSEINFDGGLVIAH